ncbi:hypothetical protein KJ819_01145 [Patescibacteria group bacterium]|nr:hypothetical protein [Patescibacteria group bacterium]MBU1500415.1 hypothetical protein [Patescibacteria group bacterium]MBU2080483.1 hypothetical protein [Patescibacteria group bacterium]MBU2123712.1 hypothetical protein [Patescibacteria group bacterium]MBU2194568.1 hypothetical protein [Patescibacteria group bacterium]
MRENQEVPARGGLRKGAGRYKEKRWYRIIFHGKPKQRVKAEDDEEARTLVAFKLHLPHPLTEEDFVRVHGKKILDDNNVQIFPPKKDTRH